MWGCWGVMALIFLIVLVLFGFFILPKALILNVRQLKEADISSFRCGLGVFTLYFFAKHNVLIPFFLPLLSVVEMHKLLEYAQGGAKLEVVLHFMLKVVCSRRRVDIGVNTVAVCFPRLVFDQSGTHKAPGRIILFQVQLHRSIQLAVGKSRSASPT